MFRAESIRLGGDGSGRLWTAAVAVSVLWGLIGFGPSPVAEATFPGDNGIIVFHDGADNLDLFVVNPDGTGLTQLTDDAAFQVAPKWGPSGERIAYHQFPLTDEGPGNFDIFIIGADGGDIVQVTDDAASDTSPAWSPDGTMLAFLSDRSGSRQIHSIDLESGELTQLTTIDEGGEGIPVGSGQKIDWSEGGIVFGNSSTGLWVMNGDGSGLVNIHPDGRFPSWHPSGSQIAFVTGDDDLAVINADGSEETLLGIKGHAPVFSPDGTMIAFSDADQSGIQVAAADGSYPVPISETGFGPDWGVASTPQFEDVSEDHIFAADIEWLAETGITRGCNPPDNDRFCPDDFVTRGQMAAFLVRALGYTDDGGGDLFEDDDHSVFEGDIDRLATAGVTRGCNPPDNDQFCPDDLVTRGQMAAFLHRALGE